MMNRARAPGAEVFPQRRRRANLFAGAAYRAAVEDDRGDRYPRCSVRLHRGPRSLIFFRASSRPATDSRRRSRVVPENLRTDVRLRHDDVVDFDRR
jgi:hypothetical protein